MHQQRDSWMPVSPATARMWALESMANTFPTRRRRLAPAVRRLAIAMTRRIPGRSGGAPVSRPEHRPQIALGGRQSVSD